MKSLINLALVILTAATLSGLNVHVALGQSISGWRTDGTGRYPTAIPPINWSTEKHVAWATPMPSTSNSTPVIVGKRLFVNSDPTTLLCVRVSDGEILWHRDNDIKWIDPEINDALPQAHGANGHSTPTPVTDGQYVYVVFGNGVAASYDLHGNRHWIQHLGDPVHAWGHSSSPAMANGTLGVLIDDLIGLDVASGKEKWRVPSKQLWGTPIATQVGEVDVFITPSGQIVRADNGEVLWHDLASLDYCSPVVSAGVVYFIEDQSVAYKLPDSLNGNPQELWFERIKQDRHYASPLIHDGLIYTVSRGEFLTVLETKTGKTVYTQQLDLGGTNSNSVYPSVTLGGSHIYIANESGTTVVLEPGRHYREVYRNELERHRSSPVFIGQRMYIRGMNHLYCIEKPTQISLLD